MREDVAYSIDNAGLVRTCQSKNMILCHFRCKAEGRGGKSAAGRTALKQTVGRTALKQAARRTTPPKRLPSQTRGTKRSVSNRWQCQPSRYLDE